ncbi:uncharacterized protein LOC132933003 [Metopolophium dirhodum]|uniref:uncharacterized protein LOC132933003 n=1 Tax=Metopolophium dirhodum TaxID=44670 RepID=UPI0029907521|nr:uncharacterized protein LOC132933003 [Metopolophium dirhodum]
MLRRLHSTFRTSTTFTTNVHSSSHWLYYTQRSTPGPITCSDSLEKLQIEITTVGRITISKSCKINIDNSMFIAESKFNRNVKLDIISNNVRNITQPEITENRMGIVPQNLTSTMCIKNLNILASKAVELSKLIDVLPNSLFILKIEFQSTMADLEDQLSRGCIDLTSENNTQSNEDIAAYNLSYNEETETDSRSIYVGNVDYAGSAEELENHFRDFGPIYKVTMVYNKFNGRPKGFAFIEFADMYSVAIAVTMNISVFRGRHIKVYPKRTNKPGISITDRPVPFRYRAAFRDHSMASFGAQSSFYGGHRPSCRSRGGYSQRSQYYPY